MKTFVIAIVLFLAVLFLAGSTRAQILFYQGFEGDGQDNWNFTTNPAAYNSGGDIWDRVSNGGQYFNPAPEGSFFWQFYDIDEIPGMPDDKVAHLTFEAVALAGEEACTLSFRYCNRGLDSEDYMAYTVALDNDVLWDNAGQIVLPKHAGDPAEWFTVHIIIPADADYCRLRLSAKANYSADCGGFDDIRIVRGALELPALQIASPSDGSFLENSVQSATLSGTAEAVSGMIVWSNALTRACGTIAATSIWSIAEIHLAEGGNLITVTATNANGLSASDSVQLSRAYNFPTDKAGSIAFTAFNSAGDSFAFALLETLPAATVIRFTDEEWEGIAFGSGETDLVWSNSAVIAAGTVVTVTNCHSAALIGATAGHIVSGRLDLSQSGEDIYAYIGPARRQPSAFLAAISTATGELRGTGLSYGLTAVNITKSPASQYYSGRRQGETIWSDYLPLINDPANWCGTSGLTESWGDGTAFVRSTAGSVLLVQ